jgi:hypothetical protein
VTQTYPLPIPSDVSSNALSDRPRYGTPGDWAVGVTGFDPGRPDKPAGTAFSKATVALASDSGAAAFPDYLPRDQNAKLIPAAAPVPAQLPGTDVLAPVGTIAPLTPYPKTGDTPAATPVVTSLSPTTGAQVTLPLVVTITGTGFTKFSQVFTGGMMVPDTSAVYVNATTMRVPIWAAAPGTVSVAVMDHSVMSNVDKVFTVT